MMVEKTQEKIKNLTKKFSLESPEKVIADYHNIDAIREREYFIFV